MKSKRKNKILIIGKKPFTGKNRMGMGGVGIHVVRLTDWLDEQKANYLFYDLSLFHLFSFYKSIKNSEIGHLHSSSPYVRLLFSFICKITNTISICTYHGDLGRFGKLKNLCDFISIWMMDFPIVLNEYSLKQAIKRNSKSLLISAYIPPINSTHLDLTLKDRIRSFCLNYKLILATNAYALSYDKNGEEIYGIIQLVDIIKTIPDIGLIISDSSGDYSKYYENKLLKNVLLIKEPHPFVGVLPFADVFVRNTSTDGDSLSIHEALDLGVPVVTTDVVSRPKGCKVIRRGDANALKKAILLVKSRNQETVGGGYNNQAEIFDFYMKYVFND